MPRSSFALSLLLLASCSSVDASSDPTYPDGNPDDDASVVTVELVNFRFSPSSLMVNAGTRVRFVNTTNTFHTVTPNGHDAWTRAETSRVETVLEVTLNSAGTFAYFCEPHLSTGMAGTITVQ